VIKILKTEVFLTNNIIEIRFFPIIKIHKMEITIQEHLIMKSSGIGKERKHLIAKGAKVVITGERDENQKKVLTK
jgi:putative NIF3 family GTP cyclohydrolase 1 type 2